MVSLSVGPRDSPAAGALLRVLPRGGRQGGLPGGRRVRLHVQGLPAREMGGRWRFSANSSLPGTWKGATVSGQAWTPLGV